MAGQVQGQGGKKHLGRKQNVRSDKYNPEGHVQNKASLSRLGRVTVTHIKTCKNVFL